MPETPGTPGTGGRPLVTFLVVAYNQERVVREAVAGALAQSWAPLEILLSDDCSDDATFEIMQEMAAGYDGPHRIRLNRNPGNLGLVAHLDRAMELVSGAFVVVNAGDDVSLAERTEKLAGAWLASGREVKLVNSQARRIDAESRDMGLDIPPEKFMHDPSPANIIRDRGYVIGATAGWDREVFDVFGPIGSGLSVEDRIIYFRAAVLGGIRHVEEALVHHRTEGISGRPGPMTAREYLYGVPHKIRKWTAEADFYVLDRFADTAYPGKAETEAVCRARGPVLGFAVDLAEASRARRLAMAPRAFRLARAQGDPRPVKDWLRYVFDRLYIVYADRRIRRDAAAAQPAGTAP